MATLTSTAIGAVSAARPAVRRGNAARAMATPGPAQSAGRGQLAMDMNNRRKLSTPAFAARAAELRAAGKGKERLARLVVSASAGEATAEEGKEGGVSKQLVLVGLFIIWYLSNIFFNIWNKQLLKLFSFPLTGTWIQLGIGSVLAILTWVLGIKKAPNVRDGSICAHFRTASPYRSPWAQI